MNNYLNFNTQKQVAFEYRNASKGFIGDTSKMLAPAGAQWDPNWNATEGSQQIVILNKRKNAGNTTVAVNTKVNVDSQGNATPETTMTFTHTSTEPKSINRGNREIDRKQALTTIINGAESHNETYNHNGVNYSVRKVDLFDYFFEYYYTNLD